MFCASWPKNLAVNVLAPQIAGVLLDEAAIGVYSNKTTSTRILPINDYRDLRPLRGAPPWIVIIPYQTTPYPHQAGSAATAASKGTVDAVGLLGAAPLMDMQFEILDTPNPAPLLTLGGALPAPITNLRN